MGKTTLWSLTIILRPVTLLFQMLDPFLATSGFVVHVGAPGPHVQALFITPRQELPSGPAVSPWEYELCKEPVQSLGQGILGSCIVRARGSTRWARPLGPAGSQPMEDVARQSVRAGPSVEQASGPRPLSFRSKASIAAQSPREGQEGTPTDHEPNIHREGEGQLGFFQPSLACKSTSHLRPDLSRVFCLPWLTQNTSHPTKLSFAFPGSKRCKTFFW